MPNILWVWLAGSALLVVLLRRTPFGRKIYAIGNRERAAYLSGIPTARVVMTCFVISGLTSALGGVLIAGRLDQSYQGMGDEYLLPAVAAVVLGGTNILGGRGSYLGTVAGRAGDQPAGVDAVRDADAGGQPAGDLRFRYHIDAAGQWPWGKRLVAGCGGRGCFGRLSFTRGNLYLSLVFAERW